MKVREHYYKGDTLYIKCCDCGEIKESGLFYPNKRNKFGIDNRCKECESKLYKKKWKDETYRQRRNRQKKEYRDAHKEEGKIYSKNYRQTHKEQCRDYSKIYRRTHPRITKKIYDKRKEKTRENNLSWQKDKENEFGINIKKFHSKAYMYANTHSLNPGACSICGNGDFVEMHHPSYVSFEKRKEVVFLCKSCHKLVHSGELVCPEPVDLIQLNAHMPIILTDKELENAIT